MGASIHIAVFRMSRYNFSRVHALKDNEDSCQIGAQRLATFQGELQNDRASVLRHKPAQEFYNNSCGLYPPSPLHSITMPRAVVQRFSRAHEKPIAKTEKNDDKDRVNNPIFNTARFGQHILKNPQIAQEYVHILSLEIFSILLIF